MERPSFEDFQLRASLLYESIRDQGKALAIIDLTTALSHAYYEGAGDTIQREKDKVQAEILRLVKTKGIQ